MRARTNAVARGPEQDARTRQRSALAAVRPARLAVAAVCALLVLAGCASTPPVHEAAREGNVFGLEQLADAGEPLDSIDDAGRTPLHYAARGGQVEAVDWLLNAGAEIDARDLQRRSPLWLAVDERETETARLLLARGADPDRSDKGQRTPLSVASSRGDVEIVSQLLEAEADPDLRDRGGRTALYRAARKGRGGVVRRLLASGASPDIPDGDGRTPLYEAVDDGDVEVVTLLLAADADPDTLSRGRESPVLRATERREVPILRALLVAGAKPDPRGPDGSTPLLRAVHNGHVPTAALLLEAGAAPDTLDSNRRTPLLWAVEARALELTRLLLAHEADMEVRGPNQMTPLAIAVRNNDYAPTELLLASGADPDSRDQLGNPPVFVAVLHQQPEIVELLLDHGAHPALRGFNGRTPLELANELNANVSAGLLREAAERMTAAGTAGKRIQRTRRPSLAPGPEALSDAEEARREALEEAREAQREALQDVGDDERDLWRDERTARREARDRAREAQRDLERETRQGSTNQPWPQGQSVDWVDPGEAAGYGLSMARRAIAEAAENIRRAMEPGGVPSRAQEGGYPPTSPAPPAPYAVPPSPAPVAPALEEPTPESGSEIAPALGSTAFLRAREPGHDPFYSRRVAIVIGINDYQHWPALEGASSDARRVSQAFRDLGFDEVVEVYDGEATRVRLLTLLGTELAHKTDDESLAMIYFAGHGQTETLPNGQKRGYIVPVDGDREQVYATGISMDRLRDLSNRLPAKQVYYAMDSCYSGLGFTRGISLVKKSDGFVRKVTSMRSVQMITAGLEGEQALEVGGQGLFTTYFLRALGGEADFDSDGFVTASEIGTYVRPQVTSASRSRQTPQFGTLEGQGEVVFALPPPLGEHPAR